MRDVIISQEMQSLPRMMMSGCLDSEGHGGVWLRPLANAA